MKRFLKLILAITLWSCLTSALLAVDSVRRRSSRRQEFGAVTEVSREKVVLRGQDGPVEIPGGDVESITFEGQAPAINLALQAEQKGNHDFALTQYRQVMATHPKALVQTDLQFYIARTVARQGLMDHEKLPEAIPLLEDFLKQHSDSYHYYDAHEWLGRVHLERGNHDAARRAFNNLRQAGWNEYQLRARLGEAEVLQRSGDFAAALAIFNEVIAAPAETGLQRQCQQEATLGKAKCLSLQGSVADAEKLLREVIASSAAEATELQARAHNLLGDCVFADRPPEEQKPKAALLAYLHVDVLPELAAHREEHAKSLYYLSKLWVWRGKQDRAADALARLKQEYPNSRWAKK